jgi:hypothetical protein
MESEPQSIDGGEVHLVVPGGGRGEEALDLLHTEDGGKPVRDLWADEGERMPVALEDVLGEEADATGAEAHRCGGQAIDIFAVQKGALQRRFRHAVGSFMVELGQETHFTDRRFLRAFALATEVKGRDHVLP